MNRLFTLNILIATSLLIGCDNNSDEFKKSTDILDSWEISKITYEFKTPIEQMVFVNDQVGFAIGYYQSTNYSEARFYKTIDAGVSWQMQGAWTTLFLQSIYFVNEQIGFIVGRRIRGGVMLLKTSNGGETWDELIWDENQGIKPIHFWDELHGLALTGPVIAKTSDGGNTWEFIDLTYKERGRDFYNIADHVVFLVGEDQKIYKITDFGNSWEAITTPISSGIVGNIYFFDENTGFIEGNTSMYKTNDGGLNWDIIDFPVSISRYFGLFHLYDETEGFFIENVFDYSGMTDQARVTGNIGYQTFDGGETWTKSDVVQSLGIMLLHFSERGLGYGYNSNTREFYTIRKK